MWSDITLLLFHSHSNSHSLALMVEPLAFGNGQVISFHTLLGIWLQQLFSLRYHNKYKRSGVMYTLTVNLYIFFYQNYKKQIMHWKVTKISFDYTRNTGKIITWCSVHWTVEYATIFLHCMVLLLHWNSMNCHIAKFVVSVGTFT